MEPVQPPALPPAPAEPVLQYPTHETSVEDSDRRKQMIEIWGGKIVKWSAIAGAVAPPLYFILSPGSGGRAAPEMMIVVICLIAPFGALLGALAGGVGLLLGCWFANIDLLARVNRMEPNEAGRRRVAEQAVTRTIDR